jgi:hypothetical protein
MFLHQVGPTGHLVHSVCPGGEMSKHYISCSGGPGVVSIKSAPGHIMPNLRFCIRWDLRVTWCISVRQGLQWDRYGFAKKRTSTHYTGLVFLHPMEMVGHVVHLGAFGV